MAYRGTLLSLLLVAIAAGVVIDGVCGESSFVRRRLAGQEASSIGVAAAPSTNCLVPCLTGLSCCKLPNTGFLPGASICTNTTTDMFNCGSCGNSCPLGSICCTGKCANLINDPNNCGVCGNKCPSKDLCSFGLCQYAA